MKRINLFKKKTGEIIGETTHCVKCGGSCFDGTGKERPATLGSGHVVKDGNIVTANFCSGWCLGDMSQMNRGWIGMPWRKEFGLKKYEP